MMKTTASAMKICSSPVNCVCSEVQVEEIEVEKECWLVFVDQLTAWICEMVHMRICFLVVTQNFGNNGQLSDSQGALFARERKKERERMVYTIPAVWMWMTLVRESIQRIRRIIPTMIRPSYQSLCSKR